MCRACMVRHQDQGSWIRDDKDRTGGVLQMCRRSPRFVATDSERHVYRLRWLVRAAYLFLGILLGGSGLTLVAVAILNRGWPGGPDLRYAFGQDSAQIS